MTLREELMDELKDTPISRFHKERFIIHSARNSLTKISSGQITATPATIQEIFQLISDSTEYVRRRAGLN